MELLKLTTRLTISNDLIEYNIFDSQRYPLQRVTQACTRLRKLDLGALPKKWKGLYLDDCKPNIDRIPCTVRDLVTWYPRLTFNDQLLESCSQKSFGLDQLTLRVPANIARTFFRMRPHAFKEQSIWQNVRSFRFMPTWSANNDLNPGTGCFWNSESR